MTSKKSVIRTLIFKQGFQTLDLQFHRYPLPQLSDQGIDIEIQLSLLHSGTDGREEMGILRIRNIIFLQLQCTYKRSFQFRKIMQRPAQERHTAADWLAAGQAGYGLIYHRLENRSREIRF